MKEIVLYLKGRFDGLYGWSKGWSADKKLLWDTYWNNIDDVFWTFVPSKGNGDADMLISVSGSIYLHPYIFKSVLYGNGVVCNGKYLGSEIKSLNKLLKECAEFTGSTYSLKVSEEIECDFGELKKVE